MVQLAATDIHNPAIRGVGPLDFSSPLTSDAPSPTAIRDRRLIHLPDLEHGLNLILLWTASRWSPNRS
jgi:hypothetical protein